MRKLIVLLLAISLVGIAPAQASVKPGAKCKKAGVTATAIKAGVCPSKVIADKDPGITQVRANALLTMTEAAAEACAMDLDWIYRLGQRDDEIFAGTFDYRIDRVTVTVMKGLVTQVNVG